MALNKSGSERSIVPDGLVFAESSLLPTTECRDKLSASNAVERQVVHCRMPRPIVCSRL